MGVVYRKNRREQSKELPSTELLGRSIYCPICRRELKGWGEGCTILHLYCENCGIGFMLANIDVLDKNDVDELEKELTQVFYNISSRW